MVERINYTRKKPSKTQTIWTYMRRNPNFRTSEILIVCTVSIEYLRRFLNALEEAKYIKLNLKKGPYSNREYRLINNTGVIAPKIIKNTEIYDENIKKSYCLNYQDLKKIPEIKRILEFIQKVNLSSKEEFCTLCKIKEEQFEYILHRLKLADVAIDSFNEGEIKNYIFDSSKATKVLRKIR